MIKLLLRRAHKIPLSILIGPIILLSPLLLSGKAMFWGTPSLQFVPWRHLAWESIRLGHAPLWNPYVGMGAPLLANYQSGIFYPPNWLLFIMDEIGGVGWAAWGQGILVAIHLAWAGLGMYCLGGRLGLGRLAQTITGLAFGLSGYLVARAGFLSINSAIAWLPWVIYYSVSYASKVKILDRHTFKLALVIAFQLLAGHAQIAWYTLLLAYAWSGIWNWHISHSLDRSRISNSALKRRFSRVADALVRMVTEWTRISMAIGVGSLLAAVQLLPTGEYLLQSQRAAAVEYDFAMTYSFWPWRLLTLIAPGMFGSPANGDYWGYGNYWEDAIYVGLLPLVLGVSVVYRKYRDRLVKTKHVSQVTESNGIRPEKIVAFLLCLIIVSLILAFGNRTPIFPWLYANIPTMAMFQAPSRYSIWAVFALTLLAGMGVDAWRRPEGRGLYWARLGTAGAFAITVGAGLGWYFLGEVSPTFIQAAAMTGVVGVAIGVLNLFAPYRGIETTQSPDRSKQIWQICTITLVMADLLSAHWGLLPGVEQNFYTTRINNENKLNNKRMFILERDEYALKYDRFFRFDTFASEDDWLNLRQIMLPNLNILSKVPFVNNFDPFVPGRYERWMAEVNQTGMGMDPARYERFLNLMGVNAVVELDPAVPLGAMFRERSGATRMRWVPCARFVGGEEEARRLVFSDLLNTDVEVVLETDSQGVNQNCSTSIISEATVKIVSEAPNQLSVNTKTEMDGWLVLSDVWYPGWRAYIDGDQSPVFRANYLFRSIYLPAGEHDVIFSYEPLSFRIGGWMSFVVWILFLSMWYFIRRTGG